MEKHTTMVPNLNKVKWFRLTLFLFCFDFHCNPFRNSFYLPPLMPMPESDISNRTSIDEQIICVFCIVSCDQSWWKLVLDEQTNYIPSSIHTHACVHFQVEGGNKSDMHPSPEKVRTIKCSKGGQPGEYSVTDNLVGCFEDLHRFSHIATWKQDINNF